MKLLRWAAESGLLVLSIWSEVDASGMPCMQQTLPCNISAQAVLEIGLHMPLAIVQRTWLQHLHRRACRP